MVSVTKQDITNVAAEFAAVPESTVDIFIEYARDLVSEKVWGTKKAKQGIVWLTCHFMSQVGLGTSGSGAGGGASGPVTMEKVGDLQRSYGTTALTSSSAMDQLLSSTKYGQLFILVRKTVFTTPIVV